MIFYECNGFVGLGHDIDDATGDTTGNDEGGDGASSTGMAETITTTTTQHTMSITKEMHQVWNTATIHTRKWQPQSIPASILWKRYGTGLLFEADSERGTCGMSVWWILFILGLAYFELDLRCFYFVCNLLDCMYCLFFCFWCFRIISLLFSVFVSFYFFILFVWRSFLILLPWPFLSLVVSIIIICIILYSTRKDLNIFFYYSPFFQFRSWCPRHIICFRQQKQWTTHTTLHNTCIHPSPTLPTTMHHK